VKRVIELLRVSTAGQAAEDKASIPTQRSINRQTALAYGLTIVRSIEISDVSGAQVLLAPEIQEMLKLMNDPEIHGVVVREFSRLMRPENFTDYAMLQAFVDTDTWLYLPEGPINFSSTDGRLLGTMRAVMGGIERTELVKKMWRIKEEKRRNGGFAQAKVCLPFGVGYDGRWYFTSDAERVGEAFRLVLGGELSYSALSRRTGIAAFNLRNILRNPIYTGVRVVDKRRDPSPRAKRSGVNGRQGDRPKIKRTPEEVIRVQVIKEPLVSEKDFNQVQRILDLKKANHWRSRDDIVHRFTYNGFLTCSCGRLVYTKYRRVDYYVCSARCGVHYMRRERIDPALDVLFAKRLTSSSFLRKVTASLNKKRAPQANNDRLRAQIESLTAKRQRILDSYFEGVINGTERDLRIAAVEREKAILAGLLAKSQPQQGLDVAKLTEIFSVFAGFDLLERDDKRRILNTIAPSIVVANYEIKGLWASFDVVPDTNHTDRDSLLRRA
jgi:DNA invertase Pin-like site-specific DNA recombinase